MAPDRLAVLYPRKPQIAFRTGPRAPCRGNKAPHKASLPKGESAFPVETDTGIRYMTNAPGNFLYGGARPEE